MLPGEPSLPEAIVAPDGQAVNRLFYWLCQQADARLASEFHGALRQHPQDWFSRHKGTLNCPDCGGQDLIRKGWRSRVVVTSRGKLKTTVIQVRCKGCGRTFRPFNTVVGLPTSLRLLEEMATKAAFLGTQVSFARACRILRGLTQGSVSSEGVRRMVAQRAARVRLPRSNPGQTVLVDATNVKAGRKERGESVYLAVTAEPGPIRHGRPTCQKRLVHLHVGSATKLKQQLKATGVTHVVHDGGEDLAGCAQYLQRCRWHLGHQLKHYFWQDGVPHAFRGQFQEAMTQIVSDPKRGPESFRRWQTNLAAIGLKTAAGHLANAEKEAFTYAKETFAYIDTSPLEREMRELNRRTDIGVRWSPKGLENVLKLMFHQRLNETQQGHR
jgi:hypothetical protein